MDSELAFRVDQCAKEGHCYCTEIKWGEVPHLMCCNCKRRKRVEVPAAINPLPFPGVSPYFPPKFGPPARLFGDDLNTLISKSPASGADVMNA